METLAALLKAAIYAAALAGAGSVLAAASLGGPPPILWRRSAAAALMAAAAASFLVLSLRLGGFDVDTLAVIAQTSPARAAGLQLAGSAFLLLPGRWPAMMGAGLVIVSFAVSGHAAAASPIAAAIAGLHVAAAAWWLGGLLRLRLAERELAPDALAGLVARFSKQAILVVAGLTLTGAVTAAILLKTNWSLEGDYPRLLAAKVAFALSAIGVAAYNKFRVSPHLASRHAARHRLRQTISLELAIIAAVVGVTAWMTTFTSPHQFH